VTSVELLTRTFVTRHSSLVIVRTYLTRRLLQAVPLLIGLAVISFLFMQAMPGGPETMLARNSRMSAEQLAVVRRSMGLDQPVIVQLGKWLANLVQGDLGLSFKEFRPVATIIGERILPTLRLVGVALGMSLVLAVLIGLLSAVKRYSAFDYAVTALSYIGLAMPVFWVALMLQLLFALYLGWLPSADMNSGEGGFGNSLWHIILPATTLAIGTIASWSRYVRGSMIEMLSQDFVRTARAKGLAQTQTVLRHAFRNALIPFVTVVALDLPFYLTGTVLVESVFNWPGLGGLFFTSLRSRDYPVLMGLLAYSAVLIIAFNLIADLLYAWLDPRIKYK
jgi:peptide/nickel transport system permease protein